MKRLIAMSVCVASCSFYFFNWLQQKPDPEIAIIITPEQQQWLEERFALEDAVNEAQKKVNIFQEKYQRILQENQRSPYSSPSSARKYVSGIELTKEFVESNNCTTPEEPQKEICKAYNDAKADQEWWARAALTAVELSAAEHDLINAKIKAGQYGENSPAIQQQQLKFMREL